jgi:hypothetical protein
MASACSFVYTPCLLSQPDDARGYPCLHRVPGALNRCTCIIPLLLEEEYIILSRTPSVVLIPSENVKLDLSPQDLEGQGNIAGCQSILDTLDRWHEKLFDGGKSLPNHVCHLTTSIGEVQKGCNQSADGKYNQTDGREKESNKSRDHPKQRDDGSEYRTNQTYHRAKSKQSKGESPDTSYDGEDDSAITFLDSGVIVLSQPVIIWQHRISSSPLPSGQAPR